jgi:hypothetical protein
MFDHPGRDGREKPSERNLFARNLSDHFGDAWLFVQADILILAN